MSILTISASNTLMESLRPTIEAEFTDKTWRSEGVYTFLELPRPTGFGLDFKVVNIIATLIFRQLASIWIKRLFRVNYGYFDPEEQKQILDKAYRRLENCPHHLYHQVYAALTGYLMDNDLINLEGFIRFRAREFWQFLQETVASNLEAEELAEHLYRKGLTDYLTVLDAQRSLYRSQEMLAVCDSQVTLNLIVLYKALGGGWESQPSSDKASETMPPTMASHSVPLKTILDGTP